ncbi:hypothetical protein [Dyadobacter sediminis]|uniref:DUF1737 domain-containing protein n=1 Tax=Dyadobacter sediminis TaxID=1493691 RepID=A0A5R9KBS2_9BACT|nr:hypothetical protein [Dyadobacter sediminis]TLU92224.1 hypothetical protein FEM55_15905 [Dyadobacter sediminis]GGB96402.1 hypothetical protein GCM10011325_24650 [Dyadobacter sediminis]
MMLNYSIKSSNIDDDTRYLIVESNGLDKLAQIVNAYIKEGWIPLGGVVVNQISALTPKEYTQAMTKIQATDKEVS